MKTIDVNDIEALTAEVNEDFGEFGRVMTVNQRKVTDFAVLTEDEQWIHVDEPRAKKESPFRTTIAHGFLIMSLLPALMPKSKFCLTGYKYIINYGGGAYRFTAPVPVGSTVHARMRLAAAEKAGKRTLLTYAAEIWVVGAEKPSLVANIKFLYA